MDFTSILNEIKPTKEEKKEITDMSEEILDYLNLLIKKENIDAEGVLVGSVSKGTYLKGKSDIDVFIAFPLEVAEEKLKEIGLFLGYECSQHFNAKAYQHYASHPYLTADIKGFEVDFVPCYKIKDGSELKSAVDRTILHTNYVKKHLKDNQKDEVLLLKRFMDATGTYGSEFKVGGFAGYLCELLIIRYGTFEKTLQEASNWKYGEVIDLENYQTSNLFTDPLIAIDPTDKNRNVGAALRLDKMAEFIQSARNYLNSDNKLDYFYKVNSDVAKEDIIEEFKNRESEIIAIKFKIPKIPLDTLHPQLKKTATSIAEQLDKNKFNVFDYSYWSDEKDFAVFIFEMDNTKTNKVKINYGPKIFYKKACKQFIDAHGLENCYVKGEFLVQNVIQENNTAEKFIKNLLNNENISAIKVGKNIQDNLIETYDFIDIDEINDKDFWEFLNNFQHKNQTIMR